MARQTSTAQAPAPVSPAAPVALQATPTPPADPYAGLTAYAADQWQAPPQEFSPTVLAFIETLKAQGRVAITVDGWAPGVASKFVKDLKAARGLFDNRRVGVKAGTVGGKPALLISLSKVPTVK